MQNTPTTICVSDRDLGTMRALVASALNTHGGVTLEYIRLLDRELRQARVLPASRLPRDVIALNSRVWATDLDSGQKTVVILVVPNHVDSSSRDTYGSRGIDGRATPARISVPVIPMLSVNRAGGNVLFWYFPTVGIPTVFRVQTLESVRTQ